ncbi:MAG: polyphosphate kinase 2 family protein [Ilumatobacteraceae bacterium]|nr:polyphosphate kinase 2 family protein [Ilumatobacteraceae bacterium]
MSDQPLSARLTAPGDDDLTLAGFDPGATLLSKSDAKDQLDDDIRPRLFDLHELMMANEDHAILLILQGLDCSGKNGTIKHVVQAMNPAKVDVASFTEPEGDEVDEHFLERIRRQVPEPGRLTVFDRSHYEDLFVPAVEDGMTGDEFDERIGEIIDFEDELTNDGVTVVKCLLHISYDEQRARFLRRLRRADKRWKFSESDVETRARWDEWQVVYGKAVGRTSTEHAPWYVIPADHKWHRNWVVGSLLVEHFERFGESYPEPFTDAELAALRARLEPPN